MLQKQRYARQLLVPKFDETALEKLKQSKVLVVGLGGLGCVAATHLALSGVGTLILNDYDTIELSNLHRQPLYLESDISRMKVEVARDRLTTLNSMVNIGIIDHTLNEAKLEMLLPTIDVVLDCLDNFPSRYRLHGVSHTTHTPVISAAAIEQQAHVALFRNFPEDPCFQCLFPYDASREDDNCNEAGVLGPVVGMVASHQALVALQWLTGISNTIAHTLYQFNGNSGDFNQYAFSKDVDCVVCGS